MKLNIIVLRDIIANVHGQPSFQPNIGGAIRSFGDECTRADEKNMLYMHPQDFELWTIGEYDDQTGVITSYDPGDDRRKQLAVGANYRKQ